ncbi:hypothetical protein BH10PSE4_BH10PSE4_24960 [soil metagenome]
MLKRWWKADATGSAQAEPIKLDLALLAVLTLAMALILKAMWYTTEVQEPDNYVEALGMLQGCASGLREHGPLHYARWLSFGYPPLAYLWGHGVDLCQRDNAFRVINSIGHTFAILTLPLLWLALRAGYGRTAAWIGALLYVLSPIFLEVGASGHQILTAFACFLAAFALLVSDFRGPWRLITALLATVLLTAALTVRFEVAFALPWLVLTHTGALNARSVIRGLIVRLTPSVVALVAFFVLRQVLVGPEIHGQEGSFFDAFFKLANLLRGLAAPVLALGLASTALAGVALVSEIYRLARDPRRSLALGQAIPLLGPLALIGFALLFWTFNPMPARHFMMLVVGACAIIAIVAARRLNLSLPVVLVAVLGIAAANQLLSEATRPLLMRLIDPHIRRPLATIVSAPTGFAWERHRLVKARAAEETAFGDSVAAATCNPRLVVISDQSAHLATSLFRHGPLPTLTAGDYGGAVRVQARWPDRAIDYIYRSRNQRTDLPAEVLADPTYAGWKVIQDPWARLMSDATDVPESRAPTIDCGGR